MSFFYTFLVRWEIPIYLVAVITLMVGLGRVIQARYQLNRALFSLQREAARERQSNAISLLIVSGLVLGGMLYFNQTIGPEIKEQLFVLPTSTPDPFSTPFASPSPLAAETSTRDRPYVTPALVATATLPSDVVQATDPDATPLPRPPTRPPEEIFIPDRGGCTPAYAISSPRPNSQVFGQVDLFGTASDPDFGYFGVEISGEGTGAEWVSIFDQQVFNRVENDYLGSANFSLLPVGEYQLRLSLFSTSTEIIGQCEIPIELVEPPEEALEEEEVTPAP